MALSVCVYVVEDDDSVARSLVALLELCGHRTSHFATADLFLAAVASLPPGCLLVDFALPGANGLDALRALRRRGIDWPAILMTGHDIAELEGEAKGLGARSVLAKPFPVELLAGELAAAGRFVPKPPLRRFRRARRLAIDRGWELLPAAIQARRPGGSPVVPAG